MSDRRAIVPIVMLGAIFMSAALSGQSPAAARLLVVLKDGRAMAIVDPATLKETGRIALGENVHEVTVSDDGRTAFVSGGVPQGTDGGRRRFIYVVDMAAQKLARHIDMGELSNPHGVQYAAGKVYFTTENYKTIGRLDATSGRIDWWLGHGQDRGHLLVVTPDATKIFVANTNSNNIAIVEGLTPPTWTVTTVPVGKAPEGITLSPDGREVWAAHTLDPNISVIDVASKRVTRTVPTGTRRAIRVKLTPDARRALVTDAISGELVVLDVGAGTVVKKLPIGTPGPCEKTQPGPTCTSAILVSPDGSRAYVSAEYDNNVAVVDLKSLEIVGRIDFGPGTHPDGMAWVGPRPR